MWAHREQCGPTQIFSSLKSPPTLGAKAWSCTLFEWQSSHHHLLDWITLPAFGPTVLPKLKRIIVIRQNPMQKLLVLNLSPICVCALSSSAPSPVLGKQSNFGVAANHFLLQIHSCSVFHINTCLIKIFFIIIASSLHPKVVGIINWSSWLICKLSEESVEVYEIAPAAAAVQLLLVAWYFARKHFANEFTLHFALLHNQSQCSAPDSLKILSTFLPITLWLHTPTCKKILIKCCQSNTNKTPIVDYASTFVYFWYFFTFFIENSGHGQNLQYTMLKTSTPCKGWTWTSVRHCLLCNVDAYHHTMPSLLNIWEEPSLSFPWELCSLGRVNHVYFTFVHFVCFSICAFMCMYICVFLSCHAMRTTTQWSH